MARFFKTGPGQYGEGDRFLGIKVPVVRRLAREFGPLALGEASRLLDSEFHEARLLALHALVRWYEKGNAEARQAIHDLYLARTDRVNNWDLVDTSAPGIVGRHLADRDRTILDRLVGSASLWERRIAIVATQHFIRNNETTDTFRLAAALLPDRHDLIHKAAGWMLREAGKRDAAGLERFLAAHASRMPRTMLRYAIERLPEADRRRHMGQ
jgi:3-methyladenine DNA glycosylase AlkD